MLFGKEDWERIQKLRIQKAVSEAIEQEMKASEKRLTDARKNVIDAEQKAANAEQKAANAEQKAASAEQKAANAEEQRFQIQQRCIIEVLKQYGEISDVVMRRIQDEKDIDVLQKWFTLALHVDSSEIFIQKIESND